MSYRNKFHPCIHIKTANLIDGTYELVPTHEDDAVSAQVNSVELIQDPNHCSEVPKANFCLRRQAPVHLNTYYFQVYTIYVVIYLSMNLSFKS